MGDIKKTILVPWDFTKVAENALLHAVRLAKIADNNIILMHIAESESSIEKTRIKLAQVAAVESRKHQIEITSIVKKGSIFKKIREEAASIGAMLVVMGTHGIKGMQKLTGSKALKVIEGSKVPFLVVQKEPIRESYGKVVFPVDFSVENKEKLRWANYLSRYYKSSVHLFVQSATEQTLLKKTKANVLFAKKYFEENLIYSDITLSKKSLGFAQETIKFAQEIDADIILIMTTKDINFTDYVFGATEQQIIANSAKIPVLCVNPRTDLKKLGGFN
jgi:nucleotide-binding universal stress UspA family protein